MLFQFNLYSSLLLIFFVHGGVYAVLLFAKARRNGHPSDFWLGLFLLLCILYIAPWMTGFAGWYDQQPYRDFLFYIPMQHLFFIGPVVYWYTRSLLNPGFQAGRKEWVHFLPGFLYLLLCVVMVVTDKIILKEYFFLASEADPDFDVWYQVAGFISMFAYAILSLRYYYLFRRIIVQLASYADTLHFGYVRNFLMAFAGMLFMRIVFFAIDKISGLDYIGSWWYFLGFAILFYYMAISGYAARPQMRIPYQFAMRNHQQVIQLVTDGDQTIKEGDFLLLDYQESPKENVVNKDAGLDFIFWKEKIQFALEKECLYENPDLTLTLLSKHLKTNASVVSKVVNDSFGQNFNDLVNSFRVAAVKTAIQQGEYKQTSLEGLGYQNGFNSKATFFRAFKKQAGITPAEYVSSIKDSGKAL
jgi:AraC-like DNA-binding protein